MTATWDEILGLDTEEKAWGHGHSTASKPGLHPVGTAEHAFQDAKHPRDARGRFIETGAHVRLLGGATGTVEGIDHAGAIIVKRDDGTGTFRVNRGALTVLKDAAGKAPSDTKPGKPMEAGDHADAVDHTPTVATGDTQALHDIAAGAQAAAPPPRTAAAPASVDDVARATIGDDKLRAAATGLATASASVDETPHVRTINTTAGADTTGDLAHVAFVHKLGKDSRTIKNDGSTGVDTARARDYVARHQARDTTLPAHSIGTTITADVKGGAGFGAGTTSVTEKRDITVHAVTRHHQPGKVELHGTDDTGRHHTTLVDADAHLTPASKRFEHSMPAEHLQQAVDELRAAGYDGPVDAKLDGKKPAEISDEDARSLVRMANQVRKADGKPEIGTEEPAKPEPPGLARLREVTNAAAEAHGLPYRQGDTVRLTTLSGDDAGTGKLHGLSPDGRTAHVIYGDHTTPRLIDTSHVHHISSAPKRAPRESVTFRDVDELRAYLRAGAPDAEKVSAQAVLDKIADDPSLKLVPNSLGTLATWGKGRNAQLIHTRGGSFIVLATDLTPASRKQVDKVGEALVGEFAGNREDLGREAAELGKRVPDLRERVNAAIAWADGTHPDIKKPDEPTKPTAPVAPKVPAGGTAVQIAPGGYKVGQRVEVDNYVHEPQANGTTKMTQAWVPGVIESITRNVSGDGGRLKGGTVTYHLSIRRDDGTTGWLNQIVGVRGGNTQLRHVRSGEPKEPTERPGYGEGLGFLKGDDEPKITVEKLGNQGRQRVTVNVGGTEVTTTSQRAISHAVVTLYVDKDGKRSLHVTLTRAPDSALREQHRVRQYHLARGESVSLPRVYPLPEAAEKPKAPTKPDAPTLPGGTVVGRHSEQGDTTPTLAANLKAGDVVVQLPRQDGGQVRYFAVTQPLRQGALRWREQDAAGNPVGDEVEVSAAPHELHLVQDNPRTPIVGPAPITDLGSAVDRLAGSDANARRLLTDALAPRTLRNREAQSRAWRELGDQAARGDSDLRDRAIVLAGLPQDRSGARDYSTAEAELARLDAGDPTHPLVALRTGARVRVTGDDGSGGDATYTGVIKGVGSARAGSMQVSVEWRDSYGDPRTAALVLPAGSPHVEAAPEAPTVPAAPAHDPYSIGHIAGARFDAAGWPGLQATGDDVTVVDAHAAVAGLDARIAALTEQGRGKVGAAYRPIREEIGRYTEIRGRVIRYGRAQGIDIDSSGTTVPSIDPVDTPATPKLPDGWTVKPNGYDDRHSVYDQRGQRIGSFDTEADARDYGQRMLDRAQLTAAPDMGPRYLKLRATFTARPERRYALKLEEHRRDLLAQLADARANGDAEETTRLSAQIGQVEQDLRRAGYGQVIGDKDAGKTPVVDTTRTMRSMGASELLPGDVVSYGSKTGGSTWVVGGPPEEIDGDRVAVPIEGGGHAIFGRDQLVTVSRKKDPEAPIVREVPDTFETPEHLGAHLAGFLGVPDTEAPYLARVFAGKRSTPDWRALNRLQDRVPAEKWQPLLQTLLPSSRSGEDRTFDGKRAADAMRRLQAGDPSLPMLSTGHRVTIRVLADGPQPLLPTPRNPLIYREVTGVVDHVSPEGLTGSVRVVITPDRPQDRHLDSHGDPLPLLTASVRGDDALPLPEGGPKVDTVVTPPAPKLPDSPPTVTARAAGELAIGDRVMVDGEPVTISGSRREGGQLVISYRPDSDPDTEWDMEVDDGETLPLVKSGADPLPPLPVEVPVELKPAAPTPGEDVASLTTTGGQLKVGDRVRTGNAIRTVTAVTDDGDPDNVSVTFDHAGVSLTAQVGRDALLDKADDGTLPTPDRHDRDMDPVRPVLYTYQRQRIVALGLDYDADRNVAAAAQRIRTRQALSGDEAHALADRLRRMADSDPNGHKARAYRRAADALDAAALHSGSLNASGTFDPSARPVKGTVRDIGEGDHVAFVNLDGATVGGKVTAVDSVMSGRMYKVTVADIDGVETTHLLNRDMGTFRLPDLSEPTVTGHPAPAAGQREHVTADRIRVGDTIQGTQIAFDGNGSRADETVTGVVTSTSPMAGGTQVVLHIERRDANGDYIESNRIAVPAARSDGGPTVIRIARGADSTDQPWDSIIPDDAPQTVMGDDLGVGDRITVPGPFGQTFTGTIDDIEEQDGDLDEGGPSRLIGLRADDGTVTSHVIGSGEDVTRLYALTEDVRAAQAAAKAERHRQAAINEVAGYLDTIVSRYISSHVANSEMGIGHSAEDMASQVHQGYGASEVGVHAVNLVRMVREAATKRPAALPANDDPDVVAARQMLASERSRLGGLYIQSLGEVAPLRGEEGFDARRRVRDQWKNTPPMQARNTRSIAESLIGGAAQAAGVTTSNPGPVTVGEVTGATLKDRVEAYRNMLPDNLAHLGKVPTERAAYGRLDLDALERGELPPIVVATDAAPDKAADAGPGHHAMAHLDVVLAAGKELGEELRRRTAGSPTGADVALANARIAELDKEIREAAAAERDLVRIQKDETAKRHGFPSWSEMNMAARYPSAYAGRWKDVPSTEFADRSRAANAEYDAWLSSPEASQLVQQLNDRHRNARTQREELRVQALAAAKDAGQARRDAALAILREIRPMGGVGLDYHSTGRKPMTDRNKLVKAMRYAENNYPTDWVNAVRQRGGFMLSGGVRGKHWGGRTRKIMLSEDGGRWVGTHDSGESGRVATHELGHAMEEHIPGLREMENAILWSRTSTGEVGSREREKYVSLGYSDKSEGSYRDKFPEPYTGKVYTGGSGNYEVFTTQAESLLAGSNYHDDQLVDWTLGVLALLGRDDAAQQQAKRAKVEAARAELARQVAEAQARAGVDDSGNRIAALDDTVTGG